MFAGRAPSAGEESETYISSLGRLNGKGRRRRAFTALKMVVVAPTPGRANTDPDCEHGDGSEGRPADQATRGVPNVLREILHVLVKSHACVPKLGGMKEFIADLLDACA